jgi:hypothetical protein
VPGTASALSREKISDNWLSPSARTARTRFQWRDQRELSREIFRPESEGSDSQTQTIGHVARFCSSGERLAKTVTTMGFFRETRSRYWAISHEKFRAWRDRSFGDALFAEKHSEPEVRLRFRTGGSLHGRAPSKRLKSRYRAFRSTPRPRSATLAQTRVAHRERLGRSRRPPPVASP